MPPRPGGGGGGGGGAESRLATVEGVVERAEEGEPRPAAAAAEVVRVDGPGHDAGQALVVGKLGLG